MFRRTTLILLTKKLKLPTGGKDKKMEWLKVSVYTTAEGIDPVCGRLYNLGITGTEIEDFEDFTDFLENNRQYWDYVDDELIEAKKGETRIIVYISNTAEGLETLLDVKNTMSELKAFDKDGKFGRLEIETDTLNEEDWANNWKQYFHPIEIGEKILVCPEWEVKDCPGKTVFKINPGMTFGTGSHYTTRLCIEQLEKYITPDCTMADLGCGSGILSVISLMLGAAHATAVDIDYNAFDIAYSNAKLNNVNKDSYRVLTGNVLTDAELDKTIADRKYDVVCANIVADVIIALLPFAKKIIRKDGIFITSGIIEDRCGDVETALSENGFKIITKKQDADWVCMVCRSGAE